MRSQAISINIKNLDDASSSSTFTVSYQVNGGTVVTETPGTAIASLATLSYTFSSHPDLSAVGTYTLKVWVSNTLDSTHANDTITATYKQLANPAIALPYAENFEGAANDNYSSSTTGLTALDRFDYSSSGGTRGRLRTYAGSGIPHGGTRAITMDAKPYGTDVNTNYLIWTLNMSSFRVDTNDIRLDFFYKSHGAGSNSNQRVWCRGSDTSAWVQLYDLCANAAAVGDYKNAAATGLSSALSAAGQQFSSSTQIRFGEQGTNGCSNNLYDDGFSFDDLNVYQVNADVGLTALLNPAIYNCELGSTASISISVTNTHFSTSNPVPVCYQN
jgi:hypothetical protein